jgi:hypothetical protein
MPEHLVDDRFACMEVDRGARRGERVGTFRMQCSVDGGEPTTLAVTNQVDAAAAMCDGAVDDLEVVDNRRIGGVVRGTNPSSDNPAAPQSPGQMLSDLQDPALRRAATNPEGLGSGLTTVSYTPIAAARRFCPPISH